VRQFRYLFPARTELRAAARYYRDRSPRVAVSFVAAVQVAVDLVLEFPESAPVVLGRTRAKKIPKFPYTILYQMDDDVVVIVAVMHHKQRPEYWAERIK
jgi:toxin ParE1/3/4